MENQNQAAPLPRENIVPPIPLDGSSFPCPSCGKPVDINAYFCPNCGKKIKDPPPSTTIGKQISLYLFALLVPPFGIIPAIKYLRAPDHKAKIIGYFTLILPVISLGIGIWLTLDFIDQVNKTVNLQQLNDIKNAGI